MCNLHISTAVVHPKPKLAMHARPVRAYGQIGWQAPGQLRTAVYRWEGVVENQTMAEGSSSGCCL